MPVRPLEVPTVWDPENEANTGSLSIQDKRTDSRKKKAVLAEMPGLWPIPTACTTEHAYTQVTLPCMA